MNKFKIPDVSFWQDDPTTAPPINFQQMATQTRGVIIRAGQGTFKDKVFDTSWKNAKLAGLPDINKKKPFFTKGFFFYLSFYPKMQ